MAIGVIWADIWNEAIWNTAIWAQTATDTPEIVSIVVAADSITFNFNTPVTFGAGGNGGFAVTLSGGACTLTYDSGDTTTALVYTTSRTVDIYAESGTAAYTQPGDGVESVSDQTDLATFSGIAIKGFRNNLVYIGRSRLAGRP